MYLHPFGALVGKLRRAPGRPSLVWTTHIQGWPAPVDRQTDSFKSLGYFLFFHSSVFVNGDRVLLRKQLEDLGKEVDLSDESALLRSAEDQLPLGG